MHYLERWGALKKAVVEEKQFSTKRTSDKLNKLQVPTAHLHLRLLPSSFTLPEKTIALVRVQYFLGLHESPARYSRDKSTMDYL